MLQDCSTQCATAACGLLRQMAGSDAMKQSIFELDGLQILQHVLETHIASAACMEAGLGLLAAVTLRQSEIALAAIRAGLPESILQVPFPLLTFFIVLNVGNRGDTFVKHEACSVAKRLQQDKYTTFLCL